MDFKNIEIIVSEVNGVITNGLDATDNLGEIVFKNFYSQDFEVINKLKPYFTFVFLSDEPSVSFHTMRKKNIPFYFTKGKNNRKIDVLQSILPRYNTTPGNLLYIGSRFSDIDCMNLAEFSMAPYDAPTMVRNKAQYITDVSGGNGVISALYDLLISNKSNLNT